MKRSIIVLGIAAGCLLMAGFAVKGPSIQGQPSKAGVPQNLSNIQAASDFGKIFSQHKGGPGFFQEGRPSFPGGPFCPPPPPFGGGRDRPPMPTLEAKVRSHPPGPTSAGS